MTARRSYGQAALDGVINDTENAPVGSRHGDLYKAGLKIGSLCAGGELSREYAEPRLLDLGRTLGLPESDVRRQVARGMDKGQRSPRSAPDGPPRTPRDRNEAILVWMKWWDEIDPVDFPGTKGSTMLRVLAAFAVQGIAHHTPYDLGLSYRQVAEAAGLSQSTITPLIRPNGPLTRWITATHRPRPHQWLNNTDDPPATRWRPIRALPGKRGFPVQPTGRAVRAMPDCVEKPRLGLNPADNVWHRRSNAWRLAGTLTEDDQTVPELAAAMGVARCTVRTNLAYLETVGMAKRVDRWTWRSAASRANAPDVAPDGIDHAELRRARHARERAAWLDYIARRVVDLQERLAEADAKRPALPSMPAARRPRMHPFYGRRAVPPDPLRDRLAG